MRTFFFFFFFFLLSLWKRRKFVLGLPKWEIFYREKTFHAGEKIRKNYFAPSEKYACYAPGFPLALIQFHNGQISIEAGPIRTLEPPPLVPHDTHYKSLGPVLFSRPGNFPAVCRLDSLISPSNFKKKIFLRAVQAT